MPDRASGLANIPWDGFSYQKWYQRLNRAKPGGWREITWKRAYGWGWRFNGVYRVFRKPILLTESRQGGMADEHKKAPRTGRPRGW